MVPKMDSQMGPIINKLKKQIIVVENFLVAFFKWGTHFIRLSIII